MVDQLSSFADEVTRVAREVGTEGSLGGQAKVKGVSGTWKDLTDNVNAMADNLTDQVRNIADVTTAVATGQQRQPALALGFLQLLEAADRLGRPITDLGEGHLAGALDQVARPTGSLARLTSSKARSLRRSRSLAFTQRPQGSVV